MQLSTRGGHPHGDVFRSRSMTTRAHPSSPVPSWPSSYASATTNGYVEAAATERISALSSPRMNPAAIATSRAAANRSRYSVLPRGVQRRQRGVVEGLCAPEQHGERLSRLTQPGHDGCRAPRPTACGCRRARCRDHRADSPFPRRRDRAGVRTGGLHPRPPTAPDGQWRPGRRSAAGAPALMGVSVFPIMRFVVGRSSSAMRSGLRVPSS